MAASTERTGLLQRYTEAREHDRHMGARFDERGVQDSPILFDATAWRVRNEVCLGETDFTGDGAFQRPARRSSSRDRLRKWRGVSNSRANAKRRACSCYLINVGIRQTNIIASSVQYPWSCARI